MVIEQRIFEPSGLKGLRIDFSRQVVSSDELAGQLNRLKVAQIDDRRDALFSGEKVNVTESRAAWHTALRLPAEQQPPSVAADMAKAKSLASEFRSRKRLLPGNKDIKDVVILGIGGSLLGPQLIISALETTKDADRPPLFRCHYIGNVDGHALDAVFAACEPEHTLFVFVSKSFTTIETQMNANHCLAWLAKNGIAQVSAKGQFVAITANRAAAKAWGAQPDLTLGFEDWVGGRYSVWSSVGFPVMLACGVTAFEEASSAAHAVDLHFAAEPIERNLPVLMACYELAAMDRGENARCVATYDERLAKLPDYLQQLEMESLGKRVGLNGLPTQSAGPLVWGTVGTTGQHSVFQWLHQGLQKNPIDFFVCAKPDHAHESLHRSMLANCLAQAQALFQGRSVDQTIAVLKSQGLPNEEVTRLAPHMTFAGGRSSTLFMLPRLNAFYLGAILALYEHKVFVLSVAFGSNAFDQYGVELGKIAAKQIDAAIENPDQATGLDEHTAAQLNWLRRH
jgi:glucose-6-phosphate isomerase